MCDLVLCGVLYGHRVGTWSVDCWPHHAVTKENMIATPLDALIALHVDMTREFHHNRVDMPVSVNLDDWLVRIAAIIDTLPATVGSHDDRDRHVKAAFVEGYNTMRRQYHLEDELDLAWEQSVSKQTLA